ncbi:XRE family transcriptional regulator [Mesorhizobium sp. M00.F.Ca.ET.186.01.1.1]|nr:XRE family transcriptional regulator [Mesorhizobium sp. M00.F.Ca.ET.186.01.1.1]
MKSIHSDSYAVFLECLKEMRRTKNLTQIELAELINRDQTYVSKYERAERRLDVIEIRTICNALGIHFIDFIRNVENELEKRGL